MQLFVRPYSGSATRFSGGGTGEGGSLGLTSEASKNEKPLPPPLTTEKFEQGLDQALTKRGMPAKKKPTALQRGISNFWLMLAGSTLALGSVFGIAKLVQGPDLSAHRPEMVELIQSGKVPKNQMSGANTKKYVQELLQQTSSFQKLDTAQKEALQKEADGLIQELDAIDTAKTNFTLPYMLLAMFGGLIGGMLLAFGISNQRSYYNQDDSTIFMKNMLLSPKRLLDRMLKEQYELAPLSEADTKAMAAGLVRVSGLASNLIDRLEKTLEAHPDVREHLAAGLGKIPSSEDLLARTLQKAMDSLLDSGKVQNQAWTKTKQINQLTLLTHLEELLQDADQTGYLLEAFIPEETSEIQKLRLQDHLSVTSPADYKTLVEFDRASAHLRFANYKSAFHHAQDQLTQSQKQLDTLNEEMTTLAAQHTPEADAKLLTLNLEKEQAEARCQSHQKQFSLAHHFQRQAQQELLKLTQMEQNQNEAALQRMLQRQAKGTLPVNIDDTLDQLVYENEIQAQLGRQVAPDSPENELSRIKAELILKQTKAG